VKSAQTQGGAKAPVPVASSPAGTLLLQRKCACGGAGGPAGECAECRKKKAGVQRRALGRGGGATASPIIHDVLASPGRPLDAGTRRFMEPRFGHDFSRVRVHTDARAAKSARAVSALAYTVGQHVVFGAGQYTPDTSPGRTLIAHELVHAVQQGPHGAVQRVAEVGPADDAYEREADRIAERVMSGGVSEDPALRAGSHVQRRMDDGHDLTATRFSRNAVLEAVFDNERELDNGDSGTAVRLIQESLLAQGYALPSFGADGDFGDETETAVRQFQIDAGAVKLDGIVGPETMGLLDMHDPGTTAPTGPGAPPAIGPPPPPTTAAFFTESVDEPFAGYDASVVPNWLVVPLNGRRRVDVISAPAGARPVFVSADPTIASVETKPNGIVVTGEADNHTTIDVQEGGAVLDTLNVEVKDQRQESAAFHYVCDSAPPPGGPHCSNGAPTADTMRSLLNRVWERQANVLFTDGGSANVVARGDLGAAVDWTSPGGGEWNTVTALGGGADYNVFRVWHYLQDGAGTNEAANLGVNTLIGDAPCADGWGLAHECGHFLGLDHPDGFIMTPCGGRVDQRVPKALADKVNP
jgi:peptidoglycan hydrolase-like protein with peptidoglycan-binding domain